jgi:hypothetical protein
MAFLDDLEHDVFVSYAHVDNIPDVVGEKGWVEQFESLLSVRLLKRFGEPVAVWRDPELRRAQLFDSVIEKAVRGSGIVVALISRRYLKSDYCAQELEWFREKATADPQGLVIDGSLRIFPVLLYNIPPKEWPEICKGTSAFMFHDAEGKEFGEPLDPKSKDFQKQLRQLVEELHSVLTRIAETEASGANPQPEESGEGEPSFRIFLSHAADVLRPTRRQIAAALAGCGVEVMTDVPPPYEDQEHAAAVGEALEKADLAVHLLAPQPGEPLNEDDPGRTYPVEQIRLGLENARSQLVLMPEELDVDLVREASYQQLLHSLGERERNASRLEVVRTGRHQMLNAILAKRTKIEEEARRAAAATATPSPGTAFIDLHNQDVPYATDLVGFLAQKQIAPIMIPSTSLSPTAGTGLFEEKLRQASFFIVVYGTVTRAWVEHRLQEAFKLILSHQLELRIGVYVAPPEKNSGEIGFPEFFVVADNMRGFDPQTLAPLLEEAVT